LRDPPMALLIYTPNGCMQWSIFLHILLSTYLFVFLITPIFTGVRWYFIMFFICISLMICMSSFERYLFVSTVQF
jgi:hypothetical protein